MRVFFQRKPRIRVSLSANSGNAGTAQRPKNRSYCLNRNLFQDVQVSKLRNVRFKSRLSGSFPFLTMHYKRAPTFQKAEATSCPMRSLQ